MKSGTAKTTAAKAAATKAAATKAAATTLAASVAAEIVNDGHLTVSQTAAKPARPEAATAAQPEAAPTVPTAAVPETETEIVAEVLIGAEVASEVAVVASAAADSAAEPVAPTPEASEAPAVLPPVAPARPQKAKKSARRIAAVAPAADAPVVLQISALSKQFGEMRAVDTIDLAVRTGSFYGIVGPNGAGKTTTLSMVTGLLRPDSGSVQVHGIDVWGDPAAAKRAIGVLPDRLRLFDRLTGAQLLYYSGILRGLDNASVRQRSADLAAAFGLEDALNRLVADYSAGMTKKIALACAMIHSPRLLVLDEPFEAVDPVSAANLIEILQRYVAAGGTVVLSSHGMDLIERVCDSVAIIVQGQVLASGTLDEVRGKASLEERFVELAGGRKAAEGMEWLHSFSD